VGWDWLEAVGEVRLPGKAGGAESGSNIAAAMPAAAGRITVRRTAFGFGMAAGIPAKSRPGVRIRQYQKAARWLKNKSALCPPAPSR